MPDSRGHQRGRPAVRDEADVDEREEEVGRLASEAADADGRAVDGGDDRLRHRAHRDQDRVVALTQSLRAIRPRPFGCVLGTHIAKIGAAREATTGTRDHHGSDRLVVPRPLERLEEASPSWSLQALRLSGRLSSIVAAPASTA
jgi:hypothetical protein